jgi:hypothetical protein
MGDIGSSHTASQHTENFQSGADNGGVASSVRSIGKGGSFAAGNGISLVLNTGGNKTTATKSKGGKKGRAGRGGTPAPASAGDVTPPASGGGGTDSQNVSGSGDIKVNISQTDQGAVQAGENVSLAAIDAIKSANEASLSLAQSALQTGADVAAVAIPTYAAAEIAGQAINPQPIDQSQSQTTAQPGNKKTLVWVAVIAGAVMIGIFARK